MILSIPKIGIFILSAKRTPFGSFGGSLRHISPTDLGEVAVRAAINASNVPFENIDTLVLGNVLHVSRSHILYNSSVHIFVS